MAEYTYTAFGMYISSEIPLALPEVSENTPKDWPVEIVRGKVPEYPHLAHALGRIRYGRVGDAIVFDVPWAARYSLEGDSRIVVDPIAGAKVEFPALYLTGLLLTVMLGARGIVTLHGSAVAGSSGSLVFIGDKGAGKSTTAAAMTAHGYRILCDDVIPIATGPRVLPGIPLPKLLPDAYERLIGDPQEAAHLFDGAGKYHASLPAGTQAAALRMIFLLEPSEEPVLRIESVKGGAKIRAILENAISLEGIDDPMLLFTRASERLASIPCFRVIRPTSGNCLDELVGAIIGLDRKGSL
ncbi:MAG: hypothetical protein CVV53_06235 [Spirochaetae bacterium HGW-Spirochaetae-9]|nr:MAG: hypothetical protein CVV53_06235 [Spirochaetae bacterium HGW-Spirochaetae-9]